MKKIETRGGSNRIVHSNPFSIRTEEADYWIGMLGADGSVSTKKNSIHIQLKDIDLLEKYRVFVSEKLTIHKKYNEAGSLMGTVLYQNKEIKDYLGTLGIIPRKSKVFKYLIPINGNILRGHFDGDGSVSQRRPKITTGSPYFKEQLEEYYDSLNIKYTTTVKDKKLNNCWDITVLYESRQTLFDLLYKNASVYLERKYNQFCACLPQGK